MSALAAIPLPRRPDLVVRPLDDGGHWVVKDPVNGAYYRVGKQEAFLLLRLDGEHTAEEICSSFEQRFGQSLSEKDLQSFVDLAESQGFLLSTEKPVAPKPRRARQSLLYWRFRFFDPDRLLSWLAPRLGFFWTRTFLTLSAAGVVLAAVLVWANRQEMVTAFARAWRWETVLLAWVTLAAVTTCHEFAHGLTCKRYGGEVHEVGFLLMFFLPCFYCNVSDAWLFPEKSKRLLVTLAGGYCDLVLWALAVFAWRLTDLASLPNYLAWVVLSVCGTRVFFNFNPLLKLDGYYLLGDWLEVPNLRQRAWGHVAEHVRWICWGAPRPIREPRAKFLLAYGVASWLFSMTYLVLMLVVFYHFLGSRWGYAGMACAGLLGLATVPGMFRGVGGGEVKRMILLRHKRTIIWLLLLVGLPAALIYVEVEDRAGGPFQVRGTLRAEVRAPVAGFLNAINFDEGDRVYSGSLLVRLEVPDLESRLVCKEAEMRESQARLRMLEEGPRKEVLIDQRARVARAAKWRDLAQEDLNRSRAAHEAELARLENQITQSAAELDFAQKCLSRIRQAGSLSAPEEFELAEKKCQVYRAELRQTRALKKTRQALGTQEAEAELARREKEWADAQSLLTLLEAGTRPEETDAERARLARLGEEVRYLKELQRKTQVTSPCPGLIMTPHLREKLGQYVREGDLICVIEEPSALQVEIALPEQEASRVQPGQPVALRARGLPFANLDSQVDRVAPAATTPDAGPLASPAVRGELAGTVTVYCLLRDSAPGFRPGMTGYARIDRGPRSLAGLLAERVMRFVRTEFWW